MTDDATLTDFLEGDDPDVTAADDAHVGAPTDGENGVDAPPEDDAHAPSTTVETATATAAWGEYTCRECGSSAERVWREGSAFVCGACKPW